MLQRDGPDGIFDPSNSDSCVRGRTEKRHGSAQVDEMLHEFLSSNRADLIARCRLKVAQRSAAGPTQPELAHGIPLFLDQLIRTLQVEQTSEPMRSRKVSGPTGGDMPVLSELAATAALHGRELSQQGVTVDQVVHAYGDLCQAITDLAFERSAPIAIDEFRTLNRCLDNGIAGAVTEYAYQHNCVATNHGVQALNERLGFFGHELRNLVHTATLAISAIKSGNVGLTGAKGAVLDRCLVALRTLIDRSLADVRVTAGMPPRHELTPLAEFVAQIASSASIEAGARECKFAVSNVDQRLAVDVDRDMHIKAVGNMLHNPVKITADKTEV